MHEKVQNDIWTRDPLLPSLTSSTRPLRYYNFFFAGQKAPVKSKQQTDDALYIPSQLLAEAKETVPQGIQLTIFHPSRSSSRIINYFFHSSGRRWCAGRNESSDDNLPYLLRTSNFISLADIEVGVPILSEHHNAMAPNLELGGKLRDFYINDQSTINLIVFCMQKRRTKIKIWAHFKTRALV